MLLRRTISQIVRNLVQTKHRFYISIDVNINLKKTTKKFGDILLTLTRFFPM